MNGTRAPLKPLLAVLVGGVAVVALFAAGIAAEQYGRRATTAAAVTTPPTTVPVVTRTSKPPAGPGDPVRDGKFEFVVTNVDCSRTSVGIEHLERTADGRFCVVTLSVRNIADEPKYLIGAAQKAFDTTGAAYSNDEITAVYLNRDTRTFFEKLDPGEKVTGRLVFDVPENARLARLELHDFVLSGGVTVSLV